MKQSLRTLREARTKEGRWNNQRPFDFARGSRVICFRTEQGDGGVFVQWRGLIGNLSDLISIETGKLREVCRPVRLLTLANAFLYAGIQMRVSGRIARSLSLTLS